MQSECRVLKPLRGAALAGAGHHRLLGAARKDNVCFPVEMLIVKLPLSSHTLSGECLFSPGRESPPGRGRWSLVSVFPAALLTPNSRHVGEQLHLAAGEGLVLALSMSWPVASVRPVPIMPALSLSSPETRGCTLWEAIQWCVVFLPQGLGSCCSESSPSPVITHCALNSS